MILRPITGREELSLFNRFPYVLNEELADDLGHGRRRPEWMWVALRDGRPLARLAWWSRPGDELPFLLDILDLDGALPVPERLDAGERLVRAAMAATLPRGSRPPEHTTRFATPGGQEGPPRAVRDRMAVLERTGARLFVERLRLEWRPGTPVPEPDGRLVFRPVREDGELVALMTAVLDGTLDAHSRDELTRMSPREAAAKQYEEELLRYPSPRDRWRVATLPSGEPVGFVLPAHNGYNPVIAYIGVLPAHRGNGYIDAVLAEGTRLLAARSVPRIRAATDLGNTPMAHAFRRAGYVTFEHEINMTWN
ncbi:GNAT family N-acetyltransferase [Streptomyces zingiberis]|uniref:GNAT family N-acetyltransferase n=1 Tax=Streptomyces zingiberis TaxID=2053010 RepID=A0ABX1BTL7_9ACTN|nr:GNAT family N-acetyltransferase [Streptomyces zingiberis]NJP99802.1 GNAT family N-acetyltransferase [Streptomyces zingiberis]